MAAQKPFGAALRKPVPAPTGSGPCTAAEQSIYLLIGADCIPSPPPGVGTRYIL